MLSSWTERGLQTLLHSDPRALEQSPGRESKMHSTPSPFQGKGGQSGSCIPLTQRPLPPSWNVCECIPERARETEAQTLLPAHPVVCSSPVAAGSWPGWPNSDDSLGSSQFRKKKKHCQQRVFPALSLRARETQGKKKHGKAAELPRLQLGLSLPGFPLPKQQAKSQRWRQEANL